MAIIIRLFLPLCIFFTAIACNEEDSMPNIEGQEGQAEALAVPQHSLKEGEKINGMSFVAPRNQVGDEAFKPMADVNCNYVAIIPFAFGQKGSSSLRFNVSFQWWGEKEEGVRESIRLSNARGMDVMVKPQIWFMGGTYTGFFTLETEEEWLEFEEDYLEYILFYARIAQDEEVPLFCIGTELKGFMLARPDFWSRLIDEVKEVYKGKLTYAGNWDSYFQFPHWDKLDYIGIDAYFPVSEEQTPSVESIEEGWSKTFDDILCQHQMLNKPILFTEFGYRSIDYCGREPWVSDTDEPVNMQAQYNALEGTFNKFWGEEWFAGGFMWKWFANHPSAGGEEHLGYTPQNKPAEELVKKVYGEQ